MNRNTVESRPMPTVAAIWWTALLWALSSAIVAAPMIVALWTPNRDDPFWPVLAAVFAVGALTGSTFRMSRDHWAGVVSGLPPAIALTVLFPISCAVAVVGENASNDVFDPLDQVIVLVGGAVVAAIGPLCRFIPCNPRNAFVAATLGWAFCSLALIPAYGVGLALTPMWIANLIAARDPRFATPRPVG